MKKNFNINSLKKYQNWKSEWNVPEWNLWDYADFHGNFDLLVSFIEIFYPNLVEYEDCIILENHFKKNNFNEWSNKLTDKSEIEAILNHLHIYDLFNNDNEENDLLNLEYVAQMIIKFWKYSIEERYPNKKFEFKYSTEPDEYGPTITFFQVRKKQI